MLGQRKPRYLSPGHGALGDKRDKLGYLTPLLNGPGKTKRAAVPMVIYQPLLTEESHVRSAVGRSYSIQGLL